jgi:hypothetical protein
MDFGFFKRNTVSLSLWTLVPVALILLVTFSVELYSASVSHTLRYRNQLLQVLPEADYHLSEAQRIVKGFAPAGGSSVDDAVADLTSFINQTADSADFSIETMERKPTKVPVPDGIKVVAITIRGNGHLENVMQFVYDIQTRENLLLVDYASVRLEDFGTRPAYVGDLVFHYYVISI